MIFLEAIWSQYTRAEQNIATFLNSTYKAMQKANNADLLNVDPQGFEPTTPCSNSRGSITESPTE